MLMQPTIENLKRLKLFGMLKALESQATMPDLQSLSFEERLGLLVDTELTTRDNRRLQMRLKLAKLAQPATIEDVDTKGHRGIDRATLSTLATSDWIQTHKNILVLGPSGVGKSYVACALAHKACRDGFTVFYDRATRLFNRLAIAKADGTYPKVLTAITRKDLMVIDDFGLAPLTQEQRHDLLELMQDRYDRRSTIITSQLPLEHWHEIIGDPTIADAILDRVVHNSHKLHLKGESRRKLKASEMQLIG